MKAVLGVSWILAGTLGFAFWQWAQLLLTAHFIGGADAVGSLSVALAIATPTFTLFGMSLRQVAASDVRRVYKDKDYLIVRFGAVLLAICLNAMASMTLTDANLGWLVLCCSFLKAVEATADISYGLRQRAGHESAVGVSQFGKSIANTLVFALCLDAGLSLPSAIISVTAVSLFLTAALDGLLPLHCARNFWVEVKRDGYPALSFRLARSAIQAGIAGCLVAIAAGWPRFVLQEELSLGAVGVFSATMWVFLPGHVLANAACQSLVGRAAAAHDSKGSGALARYVALFGCIASVCSLLPGALYLVSNVEPAAMFFGPEFAVGPTIFFLATAANLAIAISSGVNYGAAIVHAHKIQLVASIASTGSCILISATFVSVWGMEGALVSVLVTALVHFIVTGLKMNHQFGRKLQHAPNAGSN